MFSSVNKDRSVFLLLAGLFLVFLFVSVFTGDYFWILIPFGIIGGYFGWQHGNLLFFFLLAAIPFSAEYQVTPELGTDIPDEFMMLITAGVFLLYFIYNPKVLTGNYKTHTLLFFLFLSVIWTAVTVLFSTGHLVSVKFLLAKCWYLGAFVLAPSILFRDKRAIKTSFVILAVSMLAATVIILIRHAGLHFRFADVNDAVHPFFRNHVNYSAMLVCVIPLFFAFFKLSDSKKLNFFIFLSVLVLLIALFFSYSRGAWLALLAGLVSYWLINRKLLFLSFIAFIIFAAGSIFWLKHHDRYLRYAPDFKTTVFHKDFQQHLIATYRLKDVSTEERFYRWIAGVRMTGSNPLTGYGPNTFYDNYKPYAIPAFKTWVSDNQEHSTVHNYFLLVAIEQGIPGLIFFLLLMGAMFYYAQKIFSKAGGRFYKTAAATAGAIITMLVVLNFLSDLIETDKIGSIFFLCLSVLIVLDDKISSGEALERKTVK
ncbi:MAG: O-antigen ligase family protein [Chitinophagales bacterium]|nr:O-antigen ligase family protein [Chitinophagales bacterium]